MAHPSVRTCTKVGHRQWVRVLWSGTAALAIAKQFNSALRCSFRLTPLYSMNGSGISAGLNKMHF